MPHAPQASAPTSPLSRATVLALAWPVVLAQAATALTGVVDTIVMGRVGGKSDLAAVGVAAVIFSFVYWAFGFLRMSTTGLVAQSLGAGHDAQARAHLVRALVVAAIVGVVIVAAARPVEWIALASFDAAADVEQLSGEYFRARVWGAPAALMGYAVSGYLLGTGRTRALLAFQVVLNVVNAGLDTWLAGVRGWGPAGIGAGTAIAEWTSLVFGIVLVRGALAAPARLLDRDKLSGLLSANRDILIRTLALLFSFAWFVNAGASIGTAALAGNEVLLQFIAVAAFVLDAFAFVAEKEIGQAVGAGQRDRVRRAMRITTELALGFGAILSLIFFAAGPAIIAWTVADLDARAVALRYLRWCALVPILGVPAWQFDGAFIGATQGRALRRAAVIATSVYVALDFVLAPRYGNAGVWLAFVVMYLVRALALGAHWPGLLRSVGLTSRRGADSA